MIRNIWVGNGKLILRCVRVGIVQGEERLGILLFSFHIFTLVEGFSLLEEEEN